MLDIYLGRFLICLLHVSTASPRFWMVGGAILQIFMVFIAGFQYFGCAVQNITIVKGGYLQLTGNKLDIEILKTLLIITP